MEENYLENRRQEEITKFSEKHGLSFEEVDSFVEWFEWMARQDSKKIIIELIKKN